MREINQSTREKEDGEEVRRKGMRIKEKPLILVGWFANCLYRYWISAP
jgi:hypothetical protein